MTTENFTREELEEMLGEVSRHQGLKMLDMNIGIGRAFDEVAGKNKKLKLNKPISHKTTYYNRGIGNHGEIHDGSTRVVSINYDHSKKKYNVIPGEHLSGRPTTHDTIESATKALKKHVDNHIGQTETTTENFTREELEKALNEGKKPFSVNYVVSSHDPKNPEDSRVHSIHFETMKNWGEGIDAAQKSMKKVAKENPTHHVNIHAVYDNHDKNNEWVDGTVGSKVK